MKTKYCGFIKILLAVAFLATTFILPQQAFAKDTILTANVPKQAELTVNIEGGDYIVINGNKVVNGDKIMLDRLTSISFDFSQEGLDVSSVKLGDTELVGLVKDGHLSAEVNLNSDLHVTYIAAEVDNGPKITATGDDTPSILPIVIILSIALAGGITTLAIGLKKRKGK